MSPKPFLARFEEKTVHNDRFVQLAFELITPHRLEFLAGQYVSIQVSDQGERRSYSICSSPDIDHGFELLIDIKPEGLGSNFLANLQYGDEVNCLGPMGRFVIADPATDPQLPPEKALVFIATGSGISPINSMLLDLLQAKQDQRDITLYWGMRYAQDLFWLKDFQDLVDSFSNFHFYPVLSKPLPEWTLSTGHVTDLLTAHEFQPETGFYLCGNQVMIKEAKSILLAKQVMSQYIHHEQFY